MKLNRIIVVIVLYMVVWNVKAQTRVIAHRGYWKCEGSAQNSLTSLRKAAEAGVYGSEFDVQLTKDLNVVVNHDDTIKGVMISDVTYAELKDIRLKNGERISTLDEYLQVGKSLPNLQLILEIKPHRTKAEEDAVTALVVSKVQKMKMEKQVEYISFSMNICERLTQLTTNSEISYLKGDVSPEVLKAKDINGIDYHYKTFEMNPEWVEKAHELGMKVNVWTVNDTKLIQKMLDLRVDFITTDRPIETQKMLSPSFPFKDYK